MTNARAIAGTYADLKFIKTRSVAQIVCEIPIEQADAFLEMFGAPQPGKEIPVAIARLNGPVAQMQSVGVRGVEGGSPSGVAKSKTAFKDMALPQQAGIRCGDAQFQIFLSGMLGAKHPSEGSREAWTQEAVRFHCGVESRAELSTNHEAANKWRELESQYQSWLADRQYGDMQR